MAGKSNYFETVGHSGVSYHVLYGLGVILTAVNQLVETLKGNYLHLLWHCQFFPQVLVNSGIEKAKVRSVNQYKKKSKKKYFSSIAARGQTCLF